MPERDSYKNHVELMVKIEFSYSKRIRKYQLTVYLFRFFEVPGLKDLEILTYTEKSEFLSMECVQSYLGKKYFKNKRFKWEKAEGPNKHSEFLTLIGEDLKEFKEKAQLIDDSNKNEFLNIHWIIGERLKKV